jgi:hypothetical protein
VTSCCSKAVACVLCGALLSVAGSSGLTAVHGAWRPTIQAQCACLGAVAASMTLVEQKGCRLLLSGMFLRSA